MPASTVMYVFRQLVWMARIAIQLILAMGLGSGRWMVMTARVFTFGAIVALYFLPHILWYIVTPTVLRRVQYRSSERSRLQVLETILHAETLSSSGHPNGSFASDSSRSSNSAQLLESEGSDAESGEDRREQDGSNSASSPRLHQSVVLEPGSLTIDEEHIMQYLRSTYNTRLAADLGAQRSLSDSLRTTLAEKNDHEKKELIQWAERVLAEEDSSIHNRATMDIFLPVPLHELISLKSVTSSSSSSSKSKKSSRRTNHHNPHNHHAGTAPSPKFKILIMVSGGAWIIGCYLWSALLARFFAAAGYVVFVPDYRNFPQTNMGGMVDDVGDAIAWVLRNAEKYNGNTKDVTLMGHSAGAHLTMLTLLQQACRSAEAQQAAAQNPPTPTAAVPPSQLQSGITPLSSPSFGATPPRITSASKFGADQDPQIATPSANGVGGGDALSWSVSRHNSFMGNRSFGTFQTENNIDPLGSSLRTLSVTRVAPKDGESVSPLPTTVASPPQNPSLASCNEAHGFEWTARTPTSLYEVMVNDAQVLPKFDPRESVHQFVGVSGIYDVYGLLNYMHSRGLYKEVLYKLSGFQGLSSIVRTKSPTSTTSSTSPLPTPACVAQAKAAYLKAVSPVWFLGDSVASLARMWSPETTDPQLGSARKRTSPSWSPLSTSPSSSFVSPREEAKAQQEALEDLHKLLMFLPKSIKFVHGKCDKSAPTSESIKMANALAEAIALDTMIQQQKGDSKRCGSHVDGEIPTPHRRVATISVPPPTIQLILLENTNHTDPILEEQLCGSCTLLKVCASKPLPPPSSSTSPVDEKLCVKGNDFLSVCTASPVLESKKMPLLLRFGRLVSPF